MSGREQTPINPAMFNALQVDRSVEKAIRVLRQAVGENAFFDHAARLEQALAQLEPQGKLILCLDDYRAYPISSQASAPNVAFAVDHHDHLHAKFTSNGLVPDHRVISWDRATTASILALLILEAKILPNIMLQTLQNYIEEGEDLDQKIAGQIATLNLHRQHPKELASMVLGHDFVQLNAQELAHFTNCQDLPQTELDSIKPFSATLYCHDTQSPLVVIESTDSKITDPDRPNLCFLQIFFALTKLGVNLKEGAVIATLTHANSNNADSRRRRKRSQLCVSNFIEGDWQNPSQEMSTMVTTHQILCSQLITSLGADIVRRGSRNLLVSFRCQSTTEINQIIKKNISLDKSINTAFDLMKLAVTQLALELDYQQKQTFQHGL